MSLLGEIKRRKMFQVAAVYGVVSWLLIQIATTIEGPLRLPGWFDTVVIVGLVICFPITLIVSWAFNFTSDGIVRDTGQRSHSSPNRNIIEYALIGILVFAVGFLLVDNYFFTDSNPLDAVADVSGPVPGFSGRAAIAVLPFVNVSDDPDEEYFADGMTHDLNTGLQSYQIFPVISDSSMFTYKGTASDSRDIAADLGAGYVIEGSVRKIEDDVRVNVTLTDHQGRQLWAEAFEFMFESTLAIQSELVGKILLAIEPQIIVAEADRTRYVQTEDMEAYDYFLRAAANTFAMFARTDINGREVTRERNALALQYALKAVELDPNFPGGWRILSHIEGTNAYQLGYLYSPEERQAVVERSIEYGERSRQLSPFEPSVCSCLATMLLANGEVERALLLQDEAVRQNPSNAYVHAVLAQILLETRDYDRALEEIGLALRLSPRDLGMSWFLYLQAAAYEGLGRFSEAITTADRSLLFSGLNIDAEYVKIASLVALGQREVAQKAVSDLLEQQPPGFRPTSAWRPNGEFPESVANRATLASGMSLSGLRYEQGLSLLFEDLMANFQ